MKCTYIFNASVLEVVNDNEENQLYDPLKESWGRRTIKWTNVNRIKNENIQHHFIKFYEVQGL